MPDALPPELAQALAATADRRGRFGARLVFLADTASTNDVAGAMAGAGAEEGTTVLALSQSAGRGRLGRPWISPPGAGLYLSVVLRDRRTVPFVTLAAGVAVASAIRRATALPALIKWPNDIVFGDPRRTGWRKVAGLLAEASATGSEVQHVVLGCGINVRAASYPPAIAARATSLEAESGRRVELFALFGEVLASLREEMDALAAGRTGDVLVRWRSLSPSATGARVEWDGGGVRRAGTTAGIDAAGALLVRSADGVDRLVAGEVTWVTQ
jgi:BirA family biotin operon repressor/biotin-[acetyl-CoA-carboxylase] ligase